MAEMICHICQQPAHLGAGGLVHTKDNTPMCHRDGGTSYATNRVLPEGECDFCGAPRPTVEFHATQATYATMLASTGAPDNSDDLALTEQFDPDWAACDTCAVLVRSRDVDGLADRAMHTAMSKAAAAGKPIDDDGAQVMRYAVREIHEAFLSVWQDAETPIVR